MKVWLIRWWPWLLPPLLVMLALAALALFFEPEGFR